VPGELNLFITIRSPEENHTYPDRTKNGFFESHLPRLIGLYRPFL